MTNRKQEISERLEREFTICDKHILRINEALKDLSSTLPLTAENYIQLGRDQIRCIDQFIFRFSKLQDAMGAKIFRFILEYLDEDVTSLPMRDILNRLERFQILPDANEWLYIRELRNEIAHDYPMMENDVIRILNELLSKVEIMYGIYDKLKAVHS